LIRAARKKGQRWSSAEIIAREELGTMLRDAAAAIAKGDPSFQDDLCQHGFTAILEHPGSHTFAYWRSLANWRMRDLARVERRHLTGNGLREELKDLDEAEPKALDLRELAIRNV
jgi:hypothetical protein